MFERYTDKARRSIFFALREAGALDSPYIESEHLLLGLLRENKWIMRRCIDPSETQEAIRKEIEGRTVLREPVSTRADPPLSNECKRILAYGGGV